jgi:hypothetical protein
LEIGIAATLALEQLFPPDPERVDLYSVLQHISSLGKTVGSPWTQDEKTAALAGLIVSRQHGEKVFG